MDRSGLVRITRWLLPVGLAATPLVLVKSLLDPAQTSRFLYLSIFLVTVTLLLWSTDRKKFLQALSSVFRLNNFTLIAGLIWLVAALVSVSVALQKAEAFTEIARITFFLCAYVVVAAWYRFNPANIVSISIGYCLVVLLIASIGLYEFIEAWSSFVGGDSYYLMSGNIGNRNLLAIMLSLCLPFHFIVFRHFESRIVRVAVALNFLFAGAVIVLTSSRVGWLGLVMLVLIGIAAFIIAASRGLLDKKKFKKYVLALAGAIVVFIIPILLLMNNPGTAESISLRFKSMYNFGSSDNVHSESIRERLVIWKNSLRMIRENPVTGVGGGNWKVRNAEHGMTGRSAQGQVVFQQPHNDFLWVFSETGVFGGLGFLFLFVIGFISILTGFFRKSQDTQQNSLYALVCFAGLCLYTLHSFFDFPKERPLILFTFAVILALISSLRAAKATAATVFQPSRFMLPGLLLVILLTSVFWTDRMRSEFYFKNALTAQASGNKAKAIQWFDKINPFFLQADLNGIPIDFYKGEIALERKDTATSIALFQKALKLNPSHLFLLYNLGALKLRSGDTGAAIAYWKKANDIAPEFTSAAINLGAAYYNRGEIELAADAIACGKINYADGTQENIVTSVLGKYVYTLADTVSHPALRKTLLDLSANPQNLKNLQWLMAHKRISPRTAVFLQAIQTMKMLQIVTPEEAAILKNRYLQSR